MAVEARAAATRVATVASSPMQEARARFATNEEPTSASTSCIDLTAIQAAAAKPLQRKALMSAPGDKFEREADRVAEQVMRMADPAATAVGGTPLAIARTCAACEEERYQPIQAKRTAVVEGDASDTDAAMRTASRGGVPLSKELRSYFEPRFGHDFSQVRVHAEGDAARAAAGVQARAYTLGSDIVFGAGEFAPATSHGKRLLAHELVHVVQQGGSAARRVAPTGSIRAPIARTSAPIIHRQSKPGGDTGARTQTYFLEKKEKLLSGPLAAELIRLGLLPNTEIYVELYSNGYGFSTKNSHGTIALALEVENGEGVFLGYNVTTAKPSDAGGGATTAKQRQASDPQQATVAKPSKAPANRLPPSSTAAPAPAPKPAPVKSAEEMKAEFDAIPDSVKELFRGNGEIKPEDMAQVLRIANKLKALQPEDLLLYKLLAKKLTADLDSFERSIDFFIQFKARIREQADKEKKSADREPSLEDKLSKTWSGFDEKKFGGMNPKQKEDLARDIAAEQRNIQLEHMAKHPGETAVNMAEGMVRVDKTAKAIAEDVKDAADGNKGGYTRLAGAVGAYNKYVAAAASIVFVALLFVPGVNLIELAAAGLVVAAATIVLSVAESELRIKAAGEAKNPEDFKTETGKAAAAQTQAIVAAAMLALTLAMKIIARIPLPGRYQNVGAALKAAQVALSEKSGVGPAWRGIKADLLSKLRSSKQGLPEALADQTKAAADTAATVQGMSGDEFVKHLADGDPKLADLGIPPEQAKAIQQVAGTPEGKAVPEQLRQDSIKALQDAPVEAGKKVDQFLKNVDDSISNVDKAQSPEQLKAAADEAGQRLGGEEQARQATTDEQAFVKKRLEGARRSGVREQAQKKLGILQGEKVKTQAEILRLEKELFEARAKANRLKQKVQDSPTGSAERAKALEEFNAAKEALKELAEADELGGYKEERSKQNKAEEDILASLELKRPSLWQSTKDAIKKAAKRDTNGKFLDANTGEVIEGEPVYGHKYGRENRRLIIEASEKGMTQEQFATWVNEHPEWFQTETKANNESHMFEKPGID
jgi:hypothetical protein